MIKRRKRIIFIVLAVAVIMISGFIYVEKSYYPMGGNVSIISKEQGRSYTITAEQGSPNSAGFAQFKLRCSKEQYDSVDVGDIVECDRTQSTLTRKGTVHSIR